jgi:hypothetical protein
MVEVLVASAILAMSLTAIFAGLSGARDQIMRSDVLLTGRLLAMSSMEAVRHRLHVNDRRFYRLDTEPAELGRLVASEEWQRPFLTLQQSRARVLAPAGERSGWVFDPETGPVLPKALLEGKERAFFENFTYEVRVAFDVTVKPGETPAPIDADGDKRGEIDLARVEVEVYWEPVGRPDEARSITRLVSLAVSPDKSPGLELIAAEAGP